MAANPEGTSHLKLDEEIRAITGKIRASEHRDLLELVSVWAVRADDLLQFLNLHKPHIVHFSGHGSPTEEIFVLDSSGRAKPVSTAALKALFTSLKDNIRIVVLNACYSRAQAEAITEVIDFAIGMKAVISDTAAAIFAASFYGALGFGRSVQEAFDQGRIALLLEGISEEDVPEFLVRTGIDPSQVLCEPPLVDTVRLQVLSSMKALSNEITSNLDRLDEFRSKEYRVSNNVVYSRDRENVLLDYFTCMTSVFESDETQRSLSAVNEEVRDKLFQVYRGFREINDKADALKHAFRPWRASLYIDVVTHFENDLRAVAERLSIDLRQGGALRGTS
jgi:hypothetical protein